MGGCEGVSKEGSGAEAALPNSWRHKSCSGLSYGARRRDPSCSPRGAAAGASTAALSALKT